MALFNNNNNEHDDGDGVDDDDNDDDVTDNDVNINGGRGLVEFEQHHDTMIKTGAVPQVTQQ